MIKKLRYKIMKVRFSTPFKALVEDWKVQGASEDNKELADSLEDFIEKLEDSVQISDDANVEVEKAAAVVDTLKAIDVVLVAIKGDIDPLVDYTINNK